MIAFRKQYSRKPAAPAALVAAVLLAPLGVAAAPARLPAMSDADLGRIVARGWGDALLRQPVAATGSSKVIDRLTSSLDKGLNFLDMETTLIDVSYDPARARSVLNADGALIQILPNSIGEIRFDDIRVKGAAPGASFGSISIKGIDFNGSSLRMAPR